MMEVYAGFLAHADHHIGRVLDAIDASGQADDTIVAVISDNGCSAEGGRMAVDQGDQAGIGRQRRQQAFDLGLFVAGRCPLAGPQGRVPAGVEAVGRGHGQEPGAGDVFQDRVVGR